MIRATIHGGEAVRRALDGVKAGVINTVIAQATRKVGTGGVRAAKGALAGRRTGQLRRALGLKQKRYRKGEVIATVVGPRKGFKVAGPAGKPVDPTKYGHLVEGGRRAVGPVKAKALAIAGFRGRLKAAGMAGGLKRLAAKTLLLAFARFARAAAPRPFMRPAFRAMERQARSTLPGDIAAGVSRTAAKYAARGKTIYR